MHSEIQNKQCSDNCAYDIVSFKVCRQEFLIGNSQIIHESVNYKFIFNLDNELSLNHAIVQFFLWFFCIWKVSHFIHRINRFFFSLWIRITQCWLAHSCVFFFTWFSAPDTDSYLFMVNVYCTILTHIPQ